MSRRLRNLAVVIVAACVGLLAAPPRGAFADGEVQYDGTFTVAVNGDVGVAIKLTMPMAKYQKLRDNVSNLFLMMRNLASARANTEVVDKHPEWDDANRSLTFTMKVLGGARNMGGHWEMDVAKGTTFSNFDEAKRTMFFNASGSGPLGAVVGLEKLILPAEATKMSWDNARRMVSWQIPEPKRASAGTGLWIAAVAWLVGGAGILGASFVVKPKA